MSPRDRIRSPLQQSSMQIEYICWAQGQEARRDLGVRLLCGPLNSSVAWPSRGLLAVRGKVNTSEAWHTHEAETVPTSNRQMTGFGLGVGGGMGLPGLEEAV